MTKAPTEASKVDQAKIWDNFDHFNQIELDNAESGISIQPTVTKDPFQIEKIEHKEASPDFNHNLADEDDDDYEENNDLVGNSEKLERSFEKSEEDNSASSNPFDSNYIAENRALRESVTSKFNKGKNPDSSKSGEIDETKVIVENNEEDVNEQTEENQSVEIESILMKKNTSDQKKLNEAKPAAPKRNEWSKKPRAQYSKNFGSHNPDDPSRIDFDRFNNSSARYGMPMSFDDRFDPIDMTPKPNLIYPVPSRGNEFGEASFGAQAKQYQSMKAQTPLAKNPFDIDMMNYNDPAEKIPDEKIKINLAPDVYSPMENSDSKLGLKSKIPSIKKPKDELKAKQIRSFVEEQSDELAHEVKQTKKEEISPHPVDAKGKGFVQENLSMKNNDNYSNKHEIKSEAYSAKNEILSQKENSVHIDDDQTYDVSSDVKQYAVEQSTGDSVIFGTHQSHKSADPVTTAAVNASINAEIEAINQSLLKINLLMAQKDSKDVQIVPEVANNLNKSMSLWNSMMFSINQK